MHIEASNERDSTWEQHESVFRVYFTHDDAEGAGLRTSTFDVSDATFSEVAEWARDTAQPSARVAIALVGRDARGLTGLTWLRGMDPADEPESDLQRRMHAELREPSAPEPT
jgi:hypothetical protein